MCWHEVIDFVNCLEITRFRSKKGRSNLTDNWSELVRFQTLVGLILPTFVEYALTTPLAQLLRLVPPFAPVGRLLDAPKGKKKSDQNKVHHQEVCSNWDHIKGMPICSFHLTFLLVIMSLLCGQPQLPSNTAGISPWPVAIAAPSWILCQVVFVALLPQRHPNHSDN